MTDLAEVAVPLYALPPGEFVAARAARVKQARADGDRDLAGRIGALRKPSAAAWAVNQLVRRHPDDVEELLALGGRLLAAQVAREGGTLRELARRQHDLMAQARRHAADLAADAGQRLSDAVEAQVEGTLRAAMADPAAADAVRSGLLVGELVSTGFEPVDVADAVAVPDAPPLTDASPASAAPPDTEQDAAAPVTLPRRGRPAPARAPVTAPDEDADGRAGAEEVRLPGRRRTTPDRVRATSAPARARSRPGATAGSGTDATAGPDADATAAPAKPDADATAHARAEVEAAARARADREERARRREREEAAEDVAQADQDAAVAAEHLGAAETLVADLAGRHADLARELERLTARIAEVRDAQTATSVEERHARKARDAAARTADAAARRARAARTRLDRLT